MERDEVVEYVHRDVEEDDSLVDEVIFFFYLWDFFFIIFILILHVTIHWERDIGIDFPVMASAIDKFYA